MEKKIMKPVEYAAYRGVSPAAVTGLIRRGSIKVILKDGRRFIEV